MSQQPRYQFTGGVGLGVLLGVVGIFLGPFGATAAVALVLAVGLLMPRFAALAGGLCGIGSTWLLLGLNAVRICAGTEGFCGNANFAPWLAISAALTVAGAGVGVWALARNGRA